MTPKKRLFNLFRKTKEENPDKSSAECFDMMLDAILEMPDGEEVDQIMAALTNLGMKIFEKPEVVSAVGPERLKEFRGQMKITNRAANQRIHLREQKKI